MTDDLEIRSATGADAPAVAALYRAAYGTAADLGYPSRMTEIGADTVAEWIADGSTTLVAAPDGDEAAPDGRAPIVGSVRLLEERDAPYVERLAVDPDWQDRGVGGRLVDRVEAIARDRGYDRIQLTTFEGHPFLYAWYRERGYEPIDRHDRPERSYDFVTMERRL